MTYWAAENTVSTSKLTDGIVITAKEYTDAIEAMMNGARITIVDKKMAIVYPETEEII